MLGFCMNDNTFCHPLFLRIEVWEIFYEKYLDLRSEPLESEPLESEPLESEPSVPEPKSWKKLKQKTTIETKKNAIDGNTRDLWF